MNSTKYVQSLKDNLTPDLDKGEIFHHDGAPCSRSRVTQQSLADEGVTVLRDWLAQSPDLYIIEQMWTEEKKRVRLKNPHNIEELQLSHRE